MAEQSDPTEQAENRKFQIDRRLIAVGALLTLSALVACVGVPSVPQVSVDAHTVSQGVDWALFTRVGRMALAGFAVGGWTLYTSHNITRSFVLGAMSSLAMLAAQLVAENPKVVTDVVEKITSPRTPPAEMATLGFVVGAVGGVLASKERMFQPDNVPHILEGAIWGAMLTMNARTVITNIPEPGVSLFNMGAFASQMLRVYRKIHS